MFGAIGTALSGLRAASAKVEASADNIANMDTTGALTGAPAPYAPVETQLEAQPGGGVSATNVAKPNFVPSYDPDSPFADSDGLAGAPAVDLATEIVNIDVAKTAYKANAKVMQAASDMQSDLLKIFDHKA